MTVSLIELLLGLYFFGISISIHKVGSQYSTGIDLFKLIFGIVLIVAAVYQGVKLA